MEKDTFWMLCIKLHVMFLQIELETTKGELRDLKVRHDKHKRQTLNMFLELFNDLHDRSGSATGSVAGVLQRSGLYQSSPNLNIDLMSGSYPNSMTSSISAHSGFAQYGSKTDLSNNNQNGTMQSSEYSSDLPSPDTQSPHTITTSFASSTSSSGFQDKVCELRAKLGELLERDYNILPDTSSYVRNVKWKRSRPKTGRTFTVLSRARNGVGSNDSFIPLQLGRKYV